MKLVFMMSIMFLSMSQVQANVNAVTPNVATPSVEAEIFTELENTNEDIDFDSEDELYLAIEDENNMILDKEIEKKALTENNVAPKLEAKVNKPTPIKK